MFFFIFPPSLHSRSAFRRLAERLLEKRPVLRSSSNPLKLVENPNVALQAHLGKDNLNDWSEADVLTWLALLPLFPASHRGPSPNREAIDGTGPIPTDVSTEDVDLRWIPIFKDLKVTGKDLSDKKKVEELSKEIGKKGIAGVFAIGYPLRAQIARLRTQLEQVMDVS